MIHLDENHIKPECTESSNPEPSKTKTPQKIQPLDERPTEIFTLLILILFGVLGIYHVGSNYKQPSVYNTNVSPYQSELSQYTVFSSNQTSTQEELFEGQLQIDGNTEALQKITFDINDYHPDVYYTLDLGNGQVIHPSKKTVEYEYTESGSYLVELTASYKDQETTLFSDFVDITDASLEI